MLGYSGIFWHLLSLQFNSDHHKGWNCWNSVAVVFELRCSDFDLFCSESADCGGKLTGVTREQLLHFKFDPGMESRIGGVGSALYSGTAMMQAHSQGACKAAALFCGL
jgi:hypothetical protein